MGLTVKEAFKRQLTGVSEEGNSIRPLIEGDEMLTKKTFLGTAFKPGDYVLFGMLARQEKDGCTPPDISFEIVTLSSGDTTYIEEHYSLSLKNDNDMFPLMRKKNK